MQVFGRKKTATAVAYCKRGNGLINVNGRPLDNIEPQVLKFKLLEPILLLGQDRYVAHTGAVSTTRGSLTCHLYVWLGSPVWTFGCE